jgi:cytochrome c
MEYARVQKHRMLRKDAHDLFLVNQGRGNGRITVSHCPYCHGSNGGGHRSNDRTRGWRYVIESDT